MQVDNKDYPSYDTNIGEDYFKVSNPLIHYHKGGGGPIPESIYYSASTSKYACLSYGGFASWRYYAPGISAAGGKGYFYESDISKSDCQVTMLVNVGKVSNLLGAGTNSFYFNSRDDEDYSTLTTSLNKLRFAYGIENPSPVYNNLEPITQFRYYSICAVPFIGFYSGNDIKYTDCNTFFTTYSTSDVAGVYIRLFCGSNTSRTSTAIQLANAQEIGSPVLQYEPSENDDPTHYKYDGKFSIENVENVINYIPALNGKRNLMYPILGALEINDITYKTTFINPSDSSLGIFFNPKSPFSNDNDIHAAIDTTSTYVKVPKITITKDAVMSMCATIGLMFTDKLEVARELDLTDPNNLLSDDLYFPIMENGLWQGKYYHGADNAKAQQVRENWNDDPTSPFTNGSPSFGGISASGWGRGKTPKYSQPVNGMVNMYKIDASNLKNLIDYLNNSDDSVFQKIIESSKINGDSPIESIVSVMHCPINLNKFVSGGKTPLVFNRTVVPTAQGYPIGKINDDILIGNFVINKDFDESNYLEYEPYTKYLLWIPYCNFIELEPSIIYNKKIKVYLSVELVGGTCSGRVEIDDVPYKTVPGIFGTQCTIQGFNNSQYVNSLINNLGRFAGGMVDTASSISGIDLKAGTETSANISVDPSKAIHGLGEMAGSVAQTVFTPLKFNSAGHSGSGNTSLSMPLAPMIFRFYTQDYVDKYYGSVYQFAANNGIACNFSDYLRNLNGFVQVNNPHVNIGGTLEEQALIRQHLVNGVIIKTNR